MKKIFLIVFILILFSKISFTANNISLIRDMEIENFLKEITYPIFKSANINPNDVNFYIVNDTSINAFVMGGQNIFVNIGTLINFDTPDAVIGILAHEIGHISAGHLARFNEKIKNIQKFSITSILIGLGALLTGVPELSELIIYGSLQIQQQNILKYTRGQEEVADNLAIKYLNDNNLSSYSLLISMNKFYREELEYSNNLEFYFTHPLSRNRKEFIENRLKNEKYSNNEFNNKYKNQFNFVKAKILAYNNLKITNQENNDYSTYYNSIVNMNRGNYNKSLKEINHLINKYKNYPYFYELLGDIYLSQNNIDNALKNYIKADDMIKENTLIKKMISFIIIKYEKPHLYNTAIKNLNYITEIDKTDSSTFKLLAEIYYKKNELSLSYLNLAKYYEINNNKINVDKYIKLAKKNTKDKKILEKIKDFELTQNVINKN